MYIVASLTLLQETRVFILSWTCNYNMHFLLTTIYSGQRGWKLMQIDETQANTLTAFRKCAANTETICIQKTCCKHRNAANTEMLQIQKTTTKVFPASTKSAERGLDTLVARVCDSWSYWSGPCVISSCLCCGFLTSATAHAHLAGSCRAKKWNSISHFNDFWGACIIIISALLEQKYPDV